MKRKRMIPILIAVVLLLSVAAGFLYFSTRSLSVYAGLCLIADNGSYLLIKDNSSIVLSNTKGRENLYQGIDTGDKILVLHDGIEETYPAGTGAYAVRKLGEGSVDDISQGVIESLQELGWLSRKSGGRHL